MQIMFVLHVRLRHYHSDERPEGDADGWFLLRLENRIKENPLIALSYYVFKMKVPLPQTPL